MNSAGFLAHVDLIGLTDAVLLGISIASIWLLAALGLTVIYGTIGVINMAHGELIMVGAYVSYVLQRLHVPFLLCIPGAFVVVAALGFLMERLLIRYLYTRPLDTLLATWGVSLILVQGVRLIFGSDPEYIAVPSIFTSSIQIGFFSLSVFRVFVIGLTAVVALGIWYLYQRTRFGMQIRAVTQNKEIAAAFGINASRVYSLTFAIGAGLAGIAGCLFGVLNIVLPSMGTEYVVEAFLVVVVGGGALIGSVFAGAATGELQSVFAYFTNDTFGRFLLFILIVVFLRFRPQGLFATAAARR